MAARATYRIATITNVQRDLIDKLIGSSALSLDDVDNKDKLLDIAKKHNFGKLRNADGYDHDRGAAQVERRLKELQRLQELNRVEYHIKIVSDDAAASLGVAVVTAILCGDRGKTPPQRVDNGEGDIAGDNGGGAGPDVGRLSSLQLLSNGDRPNPAWKQLQFEVTNRATEITWKLYFKKWLKGPSALFTLKPRKQPPPAAPPPPEPPAVPDAVQRAPDAVADAAPDAPPDVVVYRVVLTPNDILSAGPVSLQLYGEAGQSAPCKLETEPFNVTALDNLGALTSLQLESGGGVRNPVWQLLKVVVTNTSNGNKWVFSFDRWGDGFKAVFVPV